MAQSKKQSEAKDKLLDAAISLFSKYGFQSTTTRMIANKADVVLSAISFHFGTKENLYISALDYVAKVISSDYNPIYSKIETLYGYGEMYRENAWELICELIDHQLYVAFDMPRKEFLTLLYWEQIYHIDEYCPITTVVCQKCENTLAHLIMIYSGIKDQKWAITISRTINGSIISNGEHPMFLRRALNIEENEPLPEEIKAFAREYILSSLKSLGMAVEMRE
jgi:AcrR family transcriptional regulator